FALTTLWLRFFLASAGQLFADGRKTQAPLVENLGSETFFFAQQAQQQMLGLNIRRAELAGLVPRKEDDAPGFLRVAFKHKPIPPKVLCGMLHQTLTTSIMHLYRSNSQAIFAV